MAFGVRGERTSGIEVWTSYTGDAGGRPSSEGKLQLRDAGGGAIHTALMDAIHGQLVAGPPWVPKSPEAQAPLYNGVMFAYNLCTFSYIL